MYAIRSKRTNRWFTGIDHQAGAGSSHRLIMSEIPQLFPTKEIARVELILLQMNLSIFDIVEVYLNVKDDLFFTNS